MLIILPLLLPLVSAVSYPLIESWAGSNFFDGFRHPAEVYDNTTSGDVFWATADNTSLLYVSNQDTVILKVDNTTNVVYNEKRYAPKLLSKTQYQPGTVWVFDAVHLPYGCSVWPAFWTQGPNWPAGGEIDIMEGINGQSANQMALHTEGGGCIASTSQITGTLTASNCSIGANSGSGCTITDPRANSYGAAFASSGGGVYITEFAETYIKIWFFSRSSVPTAVTSGASSLDTSTLGTPVAEYDQSTCDIKSYFGPQILTIDITLCGVWAGIPALLAQTCPALVGDATCYTTYVINDASTTYANAYFENNYINVYSTSTTSNVAGGAIAGASGGTTATGAATTTVTKGGVGMTSTTTLGPTIVASPSIVGAGDSKVATSLHWGMTALLGVILAGMM